MSARVQVLLFDLDDTLMAHTRAVEVAIDAARERATLPGPWRAPLLGAAEPAAVRKRWHELEHEHYHRYLAGELDFAGQRAARARDLCAEHGLELEPVEALAWFDLYFEGYRAAWTLFDDVLPALGGLERALPGIRFGIITNGDLDFQTVKLHRTSLWNRLDLSPMRADGSIDDPARRGRLIASGELGVTKPDPSIFAAAAAAFELPATSCAYIGDRVRTDAIGAHDAGMLGIWLDRGPARNAMTDVAEGTHVELPAGVPSLTTLLELPALLTS